MALSVRISKLLLVAFLLVAALVIGGFMKIRPASAPQISAPVSVASQEWQLGQEVILSIQTDPPRPDQTVELLVLPPPHESIQIPSRGRDYFGLAGIQLLWLPTEHREIELALAAASGATFVGLDFDWRRIQPERDRFRWEETDEIVRLAGKYDVRLVPMLLYTSRWASSAPYAPLDYHRAPPADFEDFRRFVHAVVDRYKPDGSSGLTSGDYGITDWVIWNEPNVRPVGEDPIPGEFWTGSLEQYIQLLRVGYEGAHAADPGCNVLNGGLADVLWEDGRADLITSLNRLYDPNGDGDSADGGRAFFDTLNIHMYPLERTEPMWLQNRMEAVIAIMERFGDGDKPIWLTETGFGSVPSIPKNQLRQDIPFPYLSERDQAQAVNMVFTALAGYPQLEKVFWWSLRDYHDESSATNPAMEAHYGLLRADFSPKPAYLAYAELAGGERKPINLTVVTEEDGAAQAIVPGNFVNRPGNFIIFSTLAVESGQTLAYPNWTGVEVFTLTD